MRVEEYGVFFVVVVGILALVVASPALSRLLVYPRTEFFTEFWILGPDRMAEDYPFNISSDEEYKVFLGVGNRLGYCCYYLVEVKFRNESMSTPDSFNRSPSSLRSLFNVSAFVADETVWEIPLTFSFGYGVNESSLKVRFDSLVLNDVELDLSDYMVAWNSTKNGFFGFLFFELWIYDETVDGFTYHERFLRLMLNMTSV